MLSRRSLFLFALAAADALASERLELFLLPHTHADVGWLETPENLARVVTVAGIGTHDLPTPIQ